MSHDSRIKPDKTEATQLDRALSNLPRDVAPSRDLWPQIQASIESQPKPMQRPHRGLGFFGQLAAGFVLVAVTSVATYWYTRDSVSGQSLTLVTTSSSSGEAIAAEYLRARAELDRQFSKRIATLPPDTRANLVSSLADLRRASDELIAQLAQNPGNPLLQDLLLSTFQSEAQMMADANALPLDSSLTPITTRLL